MDKIKSLLKIPWVPLVLAFVAGLVIGLPILGWWIWPVQWVDAEPRDLRADLKQDFLCLVVDSYAANGDVPLAMQRMEVAGYTADTAPDALRALSPAQCKRENANKIMDLVGAVQASSGIVSNPTGETPLGTVPPVPTPSVGKTKPNSNALSYLLLAGLCVVLAAIAGTTNLGNKTQKLINALQTSLYVILADLRGIEMSTGPLKRLYLGSTTDLEVLKSAAAMIFSMTSSTCVLEKNLRWAPVDIQAEVILHAIFANRKSETEQLGAIDDVVLFDSEKIQVEVIRQAMIAGRTGFAKLCAEKMLVDNHLGLQSLLPHELALVYFASGDLDKADEALPCVSAMHSGDDNKDTGISSVVATGLRILEQYAIDSSEFKSRPIVGNGAILPQFMSPVEDILRSDKWFDSDNMELAESTCKAAVSRLHEQILNRTFSFSFTLPERLANAIDILVRRGLIEDARKSLSLILARQHTNITILGTQQQVNRILNLQDEELDTLEIMEALDPESVDLRLVIGEAYSAKGLWDEACEVYQSGLMQHPQANPCEWMALASAAYESKQYGIGIRACEAAIELSPDNGLFYALLGKLCAAAGKSDQAEESFQYAVRLNPDHIDGWMALYELYEDQGLSKKAAALLKEAQLVNPSQPKLVFLFAKTLIAEGSKTDALALLRKAAQGSTRTDEIVKLFIETLADLGYLQEAWQVLIDNQESMADKAALKVLQGKLYIAQGRFVDAAITLQEAVSMNGGDGENHILLANALFFLDAESGKKIISHEQIVRLSEKLEKIWSVDSQDLKLSALLANILRLAGEFHKAKAIYVRIDENSGRLPQVYATGVSLGYAETCLQLREYSEALAVIDDGKTISQDRNDFMRLETRVRMEMGETSAACEIAQECLQSQPTSPEILEWYADTMQKAGYIPQATEAIRTALQYDRQNAKLYTHLAILEAKGDKPEDAIATLRRLVDLDNAPAKVEDLVIGARQLVRLGDYAGALSVYQHAVKKADSHWKIPIHVESAACYYSMSKADLALSEINVACEIDPTSKYLAGIKALWLTEIGHIGDALGALDQESDMVREWTNNLSIEMLPETWQSIITKNSTKSFLASRLKVMNGDYRAALASAEQSLLGCLEDSALRLLAIEIALSLGDQERADALIRPAVAHSAEKQPDELELYFAALHAEALIGAGKPQDAIRVLDALLKTGFQDKMALSILARAYADSLQTDKAITLLQKAQQTSIDISSGDPDMRFAIEWINRDIRMAEADLSCGNYEAAKIGFIRTSQLFPYDTRAFMGIIKTVVKSAEWFNLCKEMDVTFHCPAEDVISEDAELLFDSSKEKVQQTVAQPSLERWVARKNAAFHPSHTTARALAFQKMSVDDMTALCYALRRINLPAAAYQVGEKAKNGGSVKLQQALAMAETNTDVATLLAEQAVALEPNNPIMYIACSRMYAHKGLIDLAIESAEAALQIWPEESHWHTYTGKLLIQNNDYANAIRHFELAAKYAPTDWKMLREQGQVYLSVRDGMRAQVCFDVAYHLKSDDVAVIDGLMVTNKMLGRSQQAELLAEKWLAVEPGALKPMLVIADIALSQRHLEKAYTYSKQAHEANPDSNEAVQLIAEVLFLAGKGEEALATLDSHAGSAAREETFVVAKTAMLLKVRGWEAALPLVQQMVVSNPNSSHAWALLAKTLWEKSDLPETSKAVMNSLRLQPENAEMLTLKGHLSQKAGQLDQAVSLYAEAIRQKPDNMDAYMAMADVYEARREYSQAISTLEKGMEYGSTSPEPYIRTSDLYKSARDYAASERVLRKAADLFPGDAAVRSRLSAVAALNLVHQSHKAGAIR